MTKKSLTDFSYAVQTTYQRKKGGGLGRSQHSFWKHDQIESFMRRQLPVLYAKFGNICIIDMHAGDGLETPHIQSDFFADGSVNTTPALAVKYGKMYDAKVILCEKDKDRRESLIKQFGDYSEIIGNHLELTYRDDLPSYDALLIINDPNGHSEQGVAIMQWIEEQNKTSDFIVVVNCRSINRCKGLQIPDKENPFAKSLLASRRSGFENEWMCEPGQWKVKLRKKQVLPFGPVKISNSMEALILLASNFIPGIPK